MSNNYNIYKLKQGCKDDLIEKIESVGMELQQTRENEGYSFEFYYSVTPHSKPLSWYETFVEFFEEDVEIPETKSYFALLLISKIEDENNENIYIVSLGKAHFYINKYIERNFGINVAVRIASEETMVLKKSRYFVGGKRQEITSYNEFSLGNYKPGESIEHLKMKSADIEQWGESNIIFADSIQITSNLNPLGLTELLNNIEEQLENQPTIEIPKLEKVIEEDIINELNNNLLEQILNENLQTIIEEFTVYGVYFCFNYLSSKFQLSYRRQDNRYIREVIEGELTIRHVRDFLNSIDENYDIDKVKLKLFTNESRGFTIPIKEVLDCFMDIDGVNYFLKEGEWLKFNNTFMEYLKRSINNITLEREQNDFNEQNYLQWKQEKERQINAPGYIGDRITYREYYFNGSQVRNGYILMDRELTQIESLLQVRRNYRLEVADLYKDNTIWSVKFFKRDEKEKIIYNIEQSKIALEFIVQDNILDNSYDVKNIGLWFIVDEGHEFNEILEINSIQILLALEFWNQKVIEYGFNPIIKFTKRINI